MPLLPSQTLIQLYTATLLVSSYLLLVNPLTLLNASPLWLLGESMHIRRATFVPSTPGPNYNPSSSSPGATLHRKASLVESVLGGSEVLGNDTRELLAILGFVLFLAAVTQGILASPLRYSKDTLISLAENSRSSKHGPYSDGSALSVFAERVYTLHTTQTLFMTLAGLRIVIEGALVAYIYLFYSDRAHKVGGSIATDRSNDGFLGFLANRIVFAVAMGDMLFWGYIWTVLKDEARDVAEVVARRQKMEEEDNQ